MNTSFQKNGGNIGRRSRIAKWLLAIGYWLQNGRNQPLASSLQRSSAFTIVEMVISVTILAITVTSVFSLIIFTINLNSQNLLKVQALELGREALEAVRNVRDTSWKNNQKFVSFLDGGTFNVLPEQFTIEPNLESASADPWLVRYLSGVTDPPAPSSYAAIRLNYVGDNVGSPPRLMTRGIVHSTTWLPSYRPSPFYRFVEAEPMDEASTPSVPKRDGRSQAYKVTVYVYYDFNGKLRKTELTQILTDWRKI